MSGFAQDINQVNVLSPGKVYTGTYPGVNLLGHTDENGVKITGKAKMVLLKVAKFGDSAVGGVLNGQQFEADFTLMQTDMAIIAASFAGATLVTSGTGTQKITWGMTAGTRIPVVTLTVVPEIPGSGTAESPLTNWSMQAIPMGDFDAVYEGGKWVGFKCKFTGIVNESGAANNSWNGTFGDATISVSGTTPTVSSIIPAQGATGVSTSAAVVATLNEVVQAQTVSSATCYLLEDNSNAFTNVPCTVTYNAAGPTITLTPKSTLTGGKQYIACFLGVLDYNQNQINTINVPGYFSEFGT